MAALANPARGQLGFEVEGEPYVLAFTTNALCAVEDAFELGSIAELEGVLTDRPSLRAIRTLFRIGMHDTRPELGDEEAGRLIDAIGGLQPASELLLMALGAAFPEAAGKGAARPPKPAKAGKTGGTGKSSRPGGARSGATRSNIGG